MNKKGYVVTYLPFKKYLILTLIVVGLFLFYYLYMMKSAGLISIPKSCPSEIIPDRIILDSLGCHRYTNEYGKWGCLNNWSDGTSISNFGYNGFCHYGKLEGENANYIYCQNLIYQKTPVNPNGIVGKEINLKIDLVIDPKNETEEGYKIIDYKCKS